jgi:hypothetical protein
METSDIINFLLVLAFVVVAPILRAVSKSKSNKNKLNASVSGANSQNKKSVFNSIVGEFLETQSGKENTENYNQNIPVDMNSNVESYQPEVDSQHIGNDNKNIEKEKVRKNVDKEDVVEQQKDRVNDFKKNLNDFDLKKAIIYSEILNTKYF